MHAWVSIAYQPTHLQPAEKQAQRRGEDMRVEPNEVTRPVEELGLVAKKPVLKIRRQIMRERCHNQTTQPKHQPDADPFHDSNRRHPGDRVRKSRHESFAARLATGSQSRLPAEVQPELEGLTDGRLEF